MSDNASQPNLLLPTANSSGTAFDRDKLKASISGLADKGIYIGTSSWKYPGWRGMLYQEDRYIYRGKFSETRFDRLCLGEYAEVFKSVCVDAAYYKFPDERYLKNLVSEVPEDFLFTFKVTDDITIKQFPELPRFGLRAGRPNEHFLNADLFAAAFLKPCEEFKKNIGLLMFEFSRFGPHDFARGRDFVEALDQFLGKLPKGWRYGVEIRNRNFLHPDYFEMLARHGVTHVYNSWAEMPPVSDQLELPGSVTNPEFAGARLLLKPGRKYQEAVDKFKPYDRLKEPYEDVRVAAAKLIKKALAKEGLSKLFLYVNNRLEGNALQTIIAILEKLT
ncbi:DUF72 domain-containing protein [Pedosphaera parvula]|uniref:DUF72 domain-containing protein n=1 Tax=Pedosphaera parvula (strain Ellin514) TaxID=320771 RepID=B9XRF2_PEDPL|nr:DUF72 domain-containing protein [Pedosphaera parvula]EEF57586.1 protein of unknown function DUF72 [Pedosphaera parvula Ellin514]